MEVPDWIIDEVVPRYGPHTAMLIFAIFRHGKDDVDPRCGCRRRKIKTTLERLGLMAGIRKRTAQYALNDLVDDGFIDLHTATNVRSSRAYSAHYDRAICPRLGVHDMHPTDDLGVHDMHPTAIVRESDRGAFNAPPRARPLDDLVVDDDLDKHPDPVLFSTTTETTTNVRSRTRKQRWPRQDREASTPSRDDLREWLLQEGVETVTEWCTIFGDERVFRALVALDVARERGTRITNPGGFMRTTKLETADLLPSEEEQYSALNIALDRMRFRGPVAARW